MSSIALVGQPNVGKSVIFHRLTGRYVNVSNYPGTTVEVTRGQFRDRPKQTILDTPGVLTLPARSEDEQATAHILLNEKLGALVQVGDADALGQWVDEVLAANPKEVERYRGGEAKLIGFFTGQVMKKSGGKADPKKVAPLLQSKLGNG